MLLAVALAIFGEVTWFAVMRVYGHLTVAPDDASSPTGTAFGGDSPWYGFGYRDSELSSRSHYLVRRMPSAMSAAPPIRRRIKEAGSGTPSLMKV